jgi:hypothetical protein
MEAKEETAATAVQEETVALLMTIVVRAAQEVKVVMPREVKAAEEQMVDLLLE